MQVNPSQPFQPASEAQDNIKAAKLPAHMSGAEEQISEQYIVPQEQSAPAPAQGSGLENLSLGLDSVSAESHIKDLTSFLNRSNDRALSLKEKDEVISIFEASALDGSLHDLVIHLDKSGQLEALHKELGTLVNQSGGASAVLGILTLGMSWGVEAHDNRAFNLERLFEKHHVSPEILKRLKAN